MRLVGKKLKVVRALAESPLVRSLVWPIINRDFGLPLLLASSAESRGVAEMIPMPVQGRSHGWEDQGLPSENDFQQQYRDGASPVDVLDRLLSRTDFGEAVHSPFVCVDEEGARAAAQASAERWKAGTPLGPMDGVPVPIKDEFHMAGLPTRGGTSWRNQIETEDSFLAARLRAGGAVLPGKVHCTESGMNPLGYNAHFDMPRNVFSREHGAGGSSTGSAVAVGLGMAPVAVSTDGGGSIRIPAAMNGLFGLKPSMQRISSTGDIWLGSVGHTGPISRTVVDAVSFMEVACAPDPKDPMTCWAPDWDTVIPTWRRALGRGVKGARIGVLADPMGRAQGQIGTLCQAALDALVAEGAILETVEFPLFDLANAVGALVIAGEGTANSSDDRAAHRSEMGEELRLIYGLLEAVSAQQHLLALRVRTRLRHALAELFQTVDLLALPTTGRLAAPYPLSLNRVELADTDWMASFTEFNFLANLTGLPAASIPVGFDQGLPVGLQLIGDAWDEASVIAAMAQCERIGLKPADL